MLDKGVCKIARLPRQSILARLQSFRENTRKTKRHTKDPKIQNIEKRHTQQDCQVRAFLHACLQSLLLREKKKIQTIQIIQINAEKKKNIQRKIVTSGPACKVFLEKKTKKYGEDKKTHKRQKSTENSEKTKRHKQHDYDVRAF